MEEESFHLKKRFNLLGDPKKPQFEVRAIKTSDAKYEV